MNSGGTAACPMERLDRWDENGMFSKSIRPRHVPSEPIITATASPSVPTAEFISQLEVTRTQSLVSRNMALAQALHAAEYQLITPAGATFSRDSVHCWHTDSYEPRGGRWQAVWSQATEIKRGAQRAA